MLLTELQQIINFVDDFHPALKFTMEVSETSLSFVDILVSLNGDTLKTSVSYKPTDSCSYVFPPSSRPNHSERFIPTLNSCVFAVHARTIKNESKEKKFFLHDVAILPTNPISVFKKFKPPAEKTSSDKIPTILTFHPLNWMNWNGIFNRIFFYG